VGRDVDVDDAKAGGVGPGDVGKECVGLRGVSRGGDGQEGG